MARQNSRPARGKRASADESGAFLLCVDGGSRGNPGPAAAGVVLSDSTGHVVHAAGHYLGRATNNVAEYRSAILGLKEAHRRQVGCLTVQSDSELMVRQLNGQYKVKSPLLRPLYAEAIGLLDKIGGVTVKHVPREENRAADRLVNRALDAKADVGSASGDGAAAANWPPDTFTAICTAEGCDECPGVVSVGGQWRFEGTVPPGLCIHAAAGILAAIHAARPGVKAVSATCAKEGCPASFRICLE